MKTVDRRFCATRTRPIPSRRPARCSSVCVRRRSTISTSGFARAFLRCRSRGSSEPTGPGSARTRASEVVINPGIEHGDKISVIGEHMDGTHAELVAVPEANVYPLPDGVSFEEAAAFPLVYETAYRLLVTKARPAGGRVGAPVGSRQRRRRRPGSRSRRRSARGRSSPRRATRSWSARESSEPTRRSTTRRGDVIAAVKEATGGAGVDVVLEHVGEATWQSVAAGGARPAAGSSSAARRAGRTRRRRCTGSGGSS